jgi:hypothetical protein
MDNMDVYPSTEREAVLGRFNELLTSLQGNTATSLVMDPRSDPFLCTAAQQQITRLTEALYANKSLFRVNLSVKFLSGLHMEVQEKFLRALWPIRTLGHIQLGGDEEEPCILLGTLARSLPKTVPPHDKADTREFYSLVLQGFVIESLAEVEVLVQGLRRMGRFLNVTRVALGPLGVRGGGNFDLPVGKGLLDPLVDLMADMAHAHRQVIRIQSLGDNVVAAPLVSPTAGRRLLKGFAGDTPRVFPSVLEMNGLGLDDALLATMTQALQEGPSQLEEVYLRNNPALTDGSLESWQRAIDHSEKLTTVMYGMENRDATLKLHVKLNALGRRKAVKKGLYTTPSIWCDWMAQLATDERLVQKFHFEKYCRNNDALVLTSLFLTVRSQPTFVR